MLLTTLTLLLTAADVQTTAANAEPQPKWAVNFALASSSIVNASFDFKPQVSAGPGLASITRQSFGTSSLSLERVLGEHLTVRIDALETILATRARPRQLQHLGIDAATGSWVVKQLASLSASGFSAS